MLDKNVKELINTQVNKEFYSAYLYLDFADYFYHEGLDGFGHWYDVQAQEERDHAMLMRKYLQNNGEAVTFSAIDKPDREYRSFEDPLNYGLEHEQYVTGLINAICTAAGKANDYRTLQFYDWFIKEQGEEEKNAEGLIRKYKLFGHDPKGLYALDQELLARVYAAPTLVI